MTAIPLSPDHVGPHGHAGARTDSGPASKRIVVDERAAAEGAAWLEAEEDATAMTPERLAAIEKAQAAAHDGGDDVLQAAVAIDEDASLRAGRRFTRA